MSYANPIALAIVDEVIDDLEDSNAHTICALLRSFYGLEGRLPEDVGNAAYDAARDVIQDYYAAKAVTA
jgi:hypothetical protein